jgi:hypothetical protein
MREKDIHVLEAVMKAKKDLGVRQYDLMNKYYHNPEISDMFNIKKLLDAFDVVIDKLHAFIKDAKISDYDVYINIEREHICRMDCNTMQLRAA